MPRSNRQFAGSASWFWPWCAVAVAAAGVLAFRHVAVSAVKKMGVTADGPSVKIFLGGDLWTFFDRSLLDRTPRRFPAYSIYPIDSRGIMTFPPKVQPNELLVLGQAERFLSEEFLRHPGTPPDVKVAAGPFLRENSLALVMSKDTEAQIRHAVPSPPRTLLDWLAACAAASRPGLPVTFYMANPDQCSSSWIALGELAAEQMGNLDQKQLGAAADSQLSQTLTGLGKQITVEGTSDRLEMYKLLLGRYPAGAVLLAYDYLAAPLQKGDAAAGYTVVVPEKHFHPFVQVVLLIRPADRDLAHYLPTLVQSWSDCGFVQDAFPASGTTLSPDDPYRVPAYGTMSRILDAWDSRQK